jgi:Trypsin-like peptidase domain
MRHTTSALALAILMSSPTALSSQDAVPQEILARTFLVRVGNEQGTAFGIDHNGLFYLITARHVAAGLAPTGGDIQIRKKGEWSNYPILKVIYPSSDKVDIAILKTHETVAQPYGIQPIKDNGATMGQQVWFLGYPFIEGLETHDSNNTEFPFIKRGTMSAIDSTDPDAVLLYIDGFNNEGFSGGPIIFWSFGDRRYEILGVVRGYKPDVAHVNINGQDVKTNILVNSGILIGYNITHAVDAIDKELNQHK